MAKIRIHELAKRVGLSSKDVVDRLRASGVEVRSNLSSVDEEVEALLRPGSAGGAPAPASKATPVQKPPREAGQATPPSSPQKAPAREAAPPAAAPPKIAPRPIAAKPAVGTPPAKTPGAGAPAPLGGQRQPTSAPPASPTGPSIARKPGVAPPSPATRPTGTAPSTARPGSAQPPPRPQTGPSSARPPIPSTGPRPQQAPQGSVPAGARPAGQVGRPSGPAKPAMQPMRPAKPAVVEPRPPSPPVVPAGPPKPLAISEGVTVRELADKMGVKANDILKKLLMRGVMTNVNRPMDPETARQVALEFGYETSVVSFEESAVLEERATQQGGELMPRPPVVTVMGHVDHGKTSLLDAIRETRVVDREHGGITQHIGAYTVSFKKRGITFLDTPGHEAFTLMRARGAKVTDIVVLVVAADDGVMPQTIEAIDHARAAGVPIIVAINKIDKPDAKPDVVKKQLADRNLLVEDWGGQTVCVPISAKQKIGLDDLLDMILLVADLLELKADPKVPASGTVLEARLDRSRGPVATVLVQAGTLRVGDPFIAGAVAGKVRAMLDDAGAKIQEAPPAAPVEVLGLQGVPGAGDLFKVLTEEWRARQIGAFRQQKIREESLQKSSRLTLDHLFQKIQEGLVKELSLIVKADVQGSLEALSQLLGDLSSPKVKVRVVHASTGAISESDILLAASTNSIVIGFNVRPEKKAADLAEKEQVDVRLHTVVYNVASEIKAAMVGMLEPTFHEASLGRAEVRDTFKVPKFGIIAGCLVVEGKMVRNAEVRLLRDNVVIYTGRAASLRRFKEDVGEVKSGYECGIGLEKFSDIKPGDVIEAFKVEKIVSKELYA
ncbi:MAG TPA: translation initiation factor IF-2 [Candidatus Polarisedimenticolia bacterium]|nr:translation initiation factor IF-2 [Candidatus Polarisedimenticolia bacterium]